MKKKVYKLDVCPVCSTVFDRLPTDMALKVVLLSIFSLASILKIVNCIDPGTKEQIVIGVATCLAKNPISTDDVKALFKHEKVPETPNGKCFLLCMMRHCGLVDKSDILKKEIMEQWNKKLYDVAEEVTKANTIGEHCIKEVGTTKQIDCEAAYQLALCKLKQSKELKLAPVKIEQFM